MSDERRWEDGPDPKWVVPGTLWKYGDRIVEAVGKPGLLGVHCRLVKGSAPLSGETAPLPFSSFRLPDVEPGDVVFGGGGSAYRVEERHWGSLTSGKNVHRWGWRAVVRGKTTDEAKVMFAHLKEPPEPTVPQEDVASPLAPKSEWLMPGTRWRVLDSENGRPVTVVTSAPWVSSESKTARLPPPNGNGEAI